MLLPYSEFRLEDAVLTAALAAPAIAAVAVDAVLRRGRRGATPDAESADGPAAGVRPGTARARAR